MIAHPVLLVFLLASVQIAILSLARVKALGRVFDILPTVFFIYFIPMLLSTVGVLNAKAVVLDRITSHVLPVSLFLLLITVDVLAIFRLGGKALAAFFIGAAGIMVGAVAAFLLVKPVVGGAFWGGFGALSASWTGGSANMIATKEALSVPDAVFLPMVVVDTIVPYVWMGILIAAVRWQAAFDSWNHSDRSVLEDLRRRAEGKKDDGVRGSFFLLPEMEKRSWLGMRLLILAVAILVAVVCRTGAERLTVILPFFSATGWTIISVTAVGIVASFTALREWKGHHAPFMGQMLLYFVLTAIGAKAVLSNVGTSVVLIAAGFVIVIVHVVFMLVATRVLRVPLFLAVTASQANIGGVASAPAVAAVYEPGLASVGLLLAILGNIVGTSIGILVGHICHGVAL
jgi:uncharacterized membrane protein